MFGLLNLLLLPLGAALVTLAMFRARKFRAPRMRTAILEVAFVLVAVGAWFIVRTAHYLAGPPDADVYAQTWAFQALVFLLVYLPWALFVAGTLLLAQSFAITLRSRHAL